MNAKRWLGIIGTAVLLSVSFHSTVWAQSGRGLMHGCVAFEGVSYDDVSKGSIHAKVELRDPGDGEKVAYEGQTNDRGLYDFPSVRMGEYVLRISAPGYKTYECSLYIPSDFECRLAVMLKTDSRESESRRSK